ncbi:hypothetical protein, partial [Streptomyces sp. NPDC097610]|uniref:hypothetical protein n=1 Tax=Streptomyces sp. NPDC097610 TaxID=3157227 RepID=UPI003321BD52
MPAASTRRTNSGCQAIRAPRRERPSWLGTRDPDNVLGDVSGTAATEWQQEITSQATQRNQILNANKDATKSLAAGAKALGDLLGYS